MKWNIRETMAWGLCLTMLFTLVIFDFPVEAQRVSEPTNFFGDLESPLAVRISDSPLTFVHSLGLAIAAQLPEGTDRDAVRGNILRIYGLVVDDDDKLEGLGYDPTQREAIMRALRSIGYSNVGSLVSDIEANGILVADL